MSGSPERKRRKTDKGDASADADGPATMERLPLRPVLGLEFTRSVTTVPVYVADILNTKDTSKIVKALDARRTLESLGLDHLKRIRKDAEKQGCLTIVLTTRRDADEEHNGDVNAFLDAAGISKDSLGNVRVCEVAEYPPLTRPQFEAGRQYWPTSFHENKRIAQAMTGTLFGAAELEKMRGYMRQALTEAENATKQAEADGVLGCARLCGAVMVDPSNGGRVVASGADSTTNPLMHAAFVCIDQVARQQLKKAESEGRKPGDRAPEHEQYLCTGFDFYATREPCAMCAMALVHSRIGRVFYACRDPGMGALGSVFTLNTEPVNHKFEGVQPMSVAAGKVRAQDAHNMKLYAPPPGFGAKKSAGFMNPALVAQSEYYAKRRREPRSARNGNARSG